MMATVDLQDINIITIIPYRSYSFASHNASLFSSSRERASTKISINFGSFLFFLIVCLSHAIKQLLCEKFILAYALCREKES